MIPHVTDIKIRGYHLDLYGHVNNARYLEFLEEGRWSFAEENLDMREWKRLGLAFSVVNININYRRPAFMGEIIEIRTWISRIGNASATIRQEIVLKGTETTIADADVTFVMVDGKTNKPVPMTEDILSAFESGDVSVPSLTVR
jgi:thioesterase-3